jgi:hypothetical protein
MGRKKIITLKKCVTCGEEFETGKHKEKLNCSPKCLKIYQEKNKDSRIEKAIQGIIDKYNVNHVSKIPTHSENVKKTKKERYGDENFNNREKAKNTIFEKHGVDNSMKLKETKQKSKISKKEKHGDENFNNREKARDTIFDKYGKEHHLQVEEILNKQKKTNFKLYKTEYNIQTEKAKKNLKKHNLEKFGSEYYFSSETHISLMSEEKRKRIKETLESQGLIFDIDRYVKLRKKEKDVLHYLKYKVQCEKCGNVFEISLKNEKHVCRKCYPIKKSTSIIQKELREFLNSLNINFQENNRDIIKPLEIDFFFLEFDLALELNGNYWHSENGGSKNKLYHINKTVKCFEKGIKLIHIFEDEWLLKKDIVKSRILNLLNKTNEKIYARKCEIFEIEDFEKTSFLEENHLQGNSVDKIRLGLKYNGELVSLVTFSKNRIALGAKKEKDSYELIRFCSKLNCNVIGAFNKLFKYFVKNYNPKKIVTYADCRWSGLNPENTIYKKLDFNFIKKTSPSYFYVNKKDYLNRKHRFSLCKHVLLQQFGGDMLKTEWELAQENGFDRIWDCGTLKFEFIID